MHCSLCAVDDDDATLLRARPPSPSRRVAAIKSELEDIMSTVKSAHCDPSVVLVCDRTGGRGRARAAATATTAAEGGAAAVSIEPEGKLLFDRVILPH